MRLPSLNNGANTTIYVVYGDPAQAVQQNAPGVFKASFAAVWHLDDTLATTTIADATGTHAGTATGLAPMKTIHVVQHTSGEYLGLVEDHLEGRGIRFSYSRPFAAKGSLPPAEAVVAGLILLGGGPWGSTGERRVPTFAAEVELARSCLARAIPVVGIGLGAQILAIAAGGGSETAALEFSVGEAHRAWSDALGGYLPQRYPLAVYMRDRPLPPFAPCRPTAPSVARPTRCWCPCSAQLAARRTARSAARRRPSAFA